MINLKSEAIAEDMQHIFFGPDMKEGILLTLLKMVRECVGEERQAALLSLDDPGKLNKLVNGFFRPQIMVPKHFFAKPDRTEEITLNTDPI